MNRREPALAWHGTAVACALNVVGMSLDLVIARTLPGVPTWPNLVSIAVSATVLALLVAGRRPPRLTVAGFLVHNAVIVGALWITDAYYALQPTWVPFRPHELGIFAVALLAPPILWVGVVSVAMFALGAVAQFFVFPAAIRGRLIGEPWVVVIYGLFGVVLLVYRAQRAASERARLRAEAEAATMERLARSFLALRDLANTPLQTLSLTVQLLHLQHPELAPLIDRIERALVRLRDTTEILSRYDVFVEWGSSDLSFDPVSLLEDPASLAAIGRARR